MSELFDNAGVRLYTFSHMLPALLMILWPLCAWSLPLTIGVPAMEDGLEASRTWSSICSYLERSRGLELRFRVFPEHAALLNTLDQRFIDLALLDPAWFLRRRAALAPVAELGLAGRRTHSVLLIAPKGSIVYRPEGLAGAVLALSGERESAAGYFVPLALLAQAGVRRADLKRVTFAGTAQSVLKAVAYGGIDCGGIPSGLIRNDEEARFSDFIKVVAESKPLPLPVLVRRRDDPESRFEPLRRALLAMGADPPGRSVLEAAGLSGFHPPEAAGYRALSEYMQAYETAYGPSD